MTIGIIGAGAIGTAFARNLARSDIPACLSNSRGPDSLADLVADIGGSVRAGTRNEAAAQDLVLVAVNWSKLPTALAGLPDFGGRIAIDANNPIVAPPDGATVAIRPLGSQSIAPRRTDTRTSSATDLILTVVLRLF